VESYLSALIPAMRARSAEVSFFHETDLPGDRDCINTAGVPIFDASALALLQEEVRAVRVSDAVRRYVADVVRATRTAEGVELGASPRAALALYRAAQAHAAIRGRAYVLPDDVKAQATAVLAMGNEVRVLQDFTTDPALLRKALDNFKPTEATTYNRSTTAPDQPVVLEGLQGLGQAAYDRIVANLNYFTAEQVTRALEERVQITLATMREIARATATSCCWPPESWRG